MTLKEAFKDAIEKVIEISKKENFTENAVEVYTKANLQISKIIEQDIVEKLLLPNSTFLNSDNILNLYEKLLQGKTCLILCQHPSNVDLPIFFKLIKNTIELKKAEDIISRIVAIASITVSDISMDISNLLSKGFEKVVIYPSRVIENLKGDPQDIEKELQKSRLINHKAIKHITELKNKGKIIFIFPAGTRTKEWDPDTKRILPEIASYLKIFDYFLPIGVSGNLLNITKENHKGILDGIVNKDNVIMNAGETVDSKDFLSEFKDIEDKEDRKSKICDKLYNIMENLNIKATEYKNSLIKE